MVSAFESELAARLGALEEQNLFRKLRTVASPQAPHVTVEGRELLNLSSNDYLGLANHPALKEAAAKALEKYGVGSGASRLICGSIQPHGALEEAIASFKGTEAALAFSSGYATALGTITALAGREDIVVLDKLVHASIVDAARLSGATMRVFHHNDVDDLESILRWTDGKRSSGNQVLIVTESLFSMDGDVAPLKEIVGLKEKYGAWLMLDEAHATGIFGPGRRGIAHAAGMAEQVEIQMGTLGKALGSAGGYIAGSTKLKEFLVNKARSFIFSTAPPPAVSAAAQAALKIVDSAEGVALVQRLQGNIQRMEPLGISRSPSSPILPWHVGAETSALRLSQELLAQGVYVPAIRYPTVGKGKARLRFTVSSAHQAGELDAAVELVCRLRRQIQ